MTDKIRDALAELVRVIEELVRDLDKDTPSVIGQWGSEWEIAWAAARAALAAPSVPREPIGWTDGTAATGHRVVVRLAEDISLPVGTPLYDAAINDQSGGKGVIGSLPGHTEGQKMPGPPGPIAAREGEAVSDIKDFELAQRVRVATHQLNTRIEELEADRDRLAAECERWRNVTARANPTDCAVGIKQLYDNWQQSQAERDALRAQLHEIARLWGIPPEAMPQDWRDLWRAAIDAARFQHEL